MPPARFRKIRLLLVRIRDIVYTRGGGVFWGLSGSGYCRAGRKKEGLRVNKKAHTDKNQERS